MVVEAVDQLASVVLEQRSQPKKIAALQGKLGDLGARADGMDTVLADVQKGVRDLGARADVSEKKTDERVGSLETNVTELAKLVRGFQQHMQVLCS